MLFNSIHFFVFAPIVMGVYFLLKRKGQKTWLLLASIYFYAAFEAPFTLLLLFSALATFACVRLMERTAVERARKAYLTLAILCNVSILYFFKYIDFSIWCINYLRGVSSCDSRYLEPVGVVLPMGISFFTLQAMAYAIDVYRHTFEKKTSAFDFNLFLAFFPQLVAGPIMRAKDLLHQFKESHGFSRENFEAGLRLLAWGFFKKTLVADPIGTIVDPVYAAPQNYNSLGLLLAAYFHGIQIYCDFSGYSDIAIGAGRIMGYRIPENFRRPFFSGSIAELWQRWHISLMAWLRDYVYFPLGGSRVSVVRSYINVFLVMFISGLWHGSDWHFILWGTLCSVALIVERFFLSFDRIRTLWEKVPFLLRMQYTIFVFSVPLFYFRARPAEGYSGPTDLGTTMLKRTFSLEGGEHIAMLASVIIPMIILFTVDALMEWKSSLAEKIASNRIFLYTSSLTILGLCFFIYSVTTSAPFLYFQF
ncbi:MAG: MBOAT family protein [Spirochaetales bacterium]|nr:MBOAT family protein [Spirochaetales bacterium]